MGNPRIKQARTLRRRSVRTERRLFLAEGPQALEAARVLAGCVVEVFATSQALRRHARLLDGLDVVLVEDRAAAALSEAVSPPGLVAVCRPLDRPLADVLHGRPRLVALCVEVRDPGNAGTIVRTADAAGAEAVVLAGDCVDLHNPKTLRASAGSAFQLPIALEADPAAAVAAAREAGLQVLAADGDGEVELDLAQLGASDLLAPPTAWLFGNEARGLPAELTALADHRVRIPVHGRAESLNLAAAAAVCLYASASRHRARP